MLFSFVDVVWTHRIAQSCSGDDPNLQGFWGESWTFSVCVSGTSQCSPRMGLDMTMPIMGHRYGQLVEFSG